MLLLKKLRQQGFNFKKLPADVRQAADMVLTGPENQKIEMLDLTTYKVIRKLDKSVRTTPTEVEYRNMPGNDGFNTRVDENESFARGGHVKLYPVFSDEPPSIVTDQTALFDLPATGKMKISETGKLSGAKPNNTKYVREIELSLKEVPGLKQFTATSSQDIAKFLMEIWDKNLLNIQEEFYVLYLSRSNKLVGYQQLSKGGVTGTVADPELVVATASKALARNVIIAHNHPSGSLRPSSADEALTGKIGEALRYIDARLLDHIILAPDGSYYSFMDEGMLNYAAGGILKEGGTTTDHPFRGTTHKYANAYELNKAIEAIVDSVPPAQMTTEDKAFLKYYSGYGGLEKFGAEGKGLLYEYYTPPLIAEKMWALAYKHGFNGGDVLEPAAGIGEFVKYAPDQKRITAYEINKYSAQILKILYPQAAVHHKYFEELFIVNRNTIKAKLQNLKKYELVIGNPPYGDFQGTFAGMGEKQYTRAANYIDYFIFRGLDLLKPGGLLVFIVGAEVASGGTPFLAQQMNKCKEEIMEKADLIDAYRLPNGVFDRTDVLTDIIVLKRK